VPPTNEHPFLQAVPLFAGLNPHFVTAALMISYVLGSGVFRVEGCEVVLRIYKRRKLNGRYDEFHLPSARGYSEPQSGGRNRVQKRGPTPSPPEEARLAQPLPSPS